MAIVTGWRTVWILAVLVLMGDGRSAMANPACPQNANARVTVSVNDPGPTFSSGKNIKEINAMAGSHGLYKAGKIVLGMTEATMESHYQAQMSGQPTRSGLCVRVVDIALTFGLSKHIVHIPREYPPGSCQYKVVMRHELAHVDVNRRLVRKYASIMKADLSKHLSYQGGILATDLDQGKAKHGANIEALLNKIVARFDKELQGLHAVIDQPGGKYSPENQCRSWGL